MHKLIPFHKTRRGHPRRGRTSPCASGPRMGWGDGRSAAPFMQGSSIDRNKFITEFPRHDFKRLGVPCGFEDCHERLCAEFCAFAIGVALPEQSRVGFSNGGCYCFAGISPSMTRVWTDSMSLLMIFPVVFCTKKL